MSGSRWCGWLASGCVWLGLTSTGAHAQFSLVSVEDEIAFGREANAQVREELREITDARVAAFVRRIGDRLARVASGPKYPYSFSVVDDPTVNAFALPGGPTWLHRGVLEKSTSESQVAGVLAHEIAHVAERHAADQLTRGIVAHLGLGLLGAILGNAPGASAAQTAAGVLANSAFLKLSRDDEREADRAGLVLLRRAGWDGRGMVELLEILQREARRDPLAVDTFFSSHPAPQDRIDALREAVAHSKGGTRDSREFRAVKARLRQLPAVPHRTR